MEGERTQHFFTFGKDLVKEIIMREFKKSVIDKMVDIKIYISNDGEIIITWWEEK